MADVIFNSFYVNEAKGLIDWINDDIRVALMTDSFVPDKDTMEDWADVSGECSGEGYTAGGQSLANKTVTKDNTNDLAKLDADDPVWTAVTLTNARWALYYKWATDPGDRLLIGAKDLGSNQNPNGVDFTVLHHADGVFRKKQAA